MAKTGRPEIPIDWKEVDYYLAAGCNGEQISANIGVYSDTLYDRCLKEKGVYFTTYATEKRRKGDLMLHAAQFKNAMKGNTTMQIWLGKQRLGQKETFDSESKYDKKAGELFDTLKEIKIVDSNQPAPVKERNEIHQSESSL